MLHVTSAIIENDKKILICQPSERMKLPLKWEFPGGKIEDRESKEDCLKREIRDELGLEIEVETAFTPVEHHYPELSLCLYPFLCRWTGGSLVIAEYAHAIWIEKNELQNYDWAEADVLIMKELLSL